MRACSFPPTSPSHELTVVAGAYICVKIVGPITRERAHDLTLEAHTLGKSLGLHAYLVDATEARNMASVSANYEFAYVDLRSAGFDRMARTAVLIHPNDASHDFVETAARNAGLNFTLFLKRSAALKHLGVVEPQPA